MKRGFVILALLFLSACSVPVDESKSDKLDVVVSFYPLPGLPESQKDMFKYINILLLPALFGLWGGVRLFKRR